MKTLKPIDDDVFFDVVATSEKMMPVMISIMKILEQNQCTYNETDVILYLLTDTVRYNRECKEYETCMDYILGNKTACMDNVPVKLLKHKNEN